MDFTFVHAKLHGVFIFQVGGDHHGMRFTDSGTQGQGIVKPVGKMRFPWMKIAFVSQQGAMRTENERFFL